MTLTEIRNVLDDMISKGVHVDDIIYKICPVCNSNHKGSCEHCAWRGTMNVCYVGVGVWNDGSYCEKPLQIVPRKLYRSFDSTIFELWNIQYFATEEEARKAMEEYDNIRKESNRDIRVAKYDLWEEKQRCKYVPVEDEKPQGVVSIVTHTCKQCKHYKGCIYLQYMDKQSHQDPCGYFELRTHNDNE